MVRRAREDVRSARLRARPDDGLVRAAALLVLVGIASGCALAARGTDPHVHLTFTPPPSAARLDVEAATVMLKDAAILQARAAPDDSPLAPCSLGGAAIVALNVNALWAGLERDEPRLPPPGTNILGMFDRALRGGKIPREDPAQTSEILARFYIWRLWGINAAANTFVTRLTQQECLDFLLSKTAAERELPRILQDPNLVLTHHAVVGHYSSTIPRASVDRWLSDFRDAGLLARSSAATDNSLAPCSVLRTLMISSSLSNLWISILEGTLRPPAANDPTVGRFASVLAQGTVPRSDPSQAIEITARLYGARMLYISAFVEHYLAGSTQRECLDEVFQPGLIRVRLIKEGKDPDRVAPVTR